MFRLNCVREDVQYLELYRVSRCILGGFSWRLRLSSGVRVAPRVGLWHQQRMRMKKLRFLHRLSRLFEVKEEVTVQGGYLRQAVVVAALYRNGMRFILLEHCHLGLQGSKRQGSRPYAFEASQDMAQAP